MIISTRACYAVYVNTMCEVRQKTTKKQSAALHFFENVTDQKKVQVLLVQRADILSVVSFSQLT